jgi:hypothetical protein
VQLFGVGPHRYWDTQGEYMGVRPTGKFVTSNGPSRIYPKAGPLAMIQKLARY